jgi:ribose 1,5-bisphosphokinase
MAGKLFYVMGASGSGKNAIMKHARERLNGKHPVVFAHRYITRPLVIDEENHIMLTKEAFQLRKKYGFFSMDWESYGYYYGIGKEIDLWLNNKTDVVVNGSREYLPVAVAKYPSMYTIMIEAHQDLIRERLGKRNRGSQHEIEQRIIRGNLFHDLPVTLIIKNNGILEASAKEFLKLLLAGK